MFEGLWGEPELKERLVIVRSTGQERFRHLIEDGIAEGTVRPDADADAIVLMASSALRGAMYQWGSLKTILTYAQR